MPTKLSSRISSSSSRCADAASAPRTLSMPPCSVRVNGTSRIRIAQSPSAESSAASRAVKFTGGSEYVRSSA